VREPTHDECKAHARIALDDGKTGVACWYPQMGGYTAHAVIVLDAGCVDVYVWHDGLFPFRGDEQSPVELHHCDGGQFVQFGMLIQSVTEGTTP
jgi:hypothetical protein